MFHHYLQPLIDRQDIVKYLPHRPPMVMVDRLLSIKEGVIVGDFLVRSDNPFVTDTGKMLLGGVIEHMAQTAGLGHAYQSALTSGPRDASKTGQGEFGFIVNIRSLRYERLPRLGNRLYTEAKTITQHGSHSTVTFSCYVEGHPIINCSMGLISPKDKK